MKPCAYAVFIVLILIACAPKPESVEREETFAWNPDRELDVSGWLDSSSVEGTLRGKLTGPGGLSLDMPLQALSNNGRLRWLLKPVAETASLPEGEKFSLLLGDRRGGIRKTLRVDRVPPEAGVIRTSSVIYRGGCAAVVVYAMDEEVARVVMRGPDGARFVLQPMGPNGLYGGIVCWPLTEAKFKLQLQAVDGAGNIRTMDVKMSSLPREYPVRKLNVSGHFNTEKLAEVGETNAEASSEENSYERVMEGFRKTKAIDIWEATTGPSYPSRELVNWTAFDPISGARQTSPFGQHRLFYLRNEVVRESYHYGLDLAKHTHTPVWVRNPGEVTFAGYNGALGNIALVHYGFGLYTLYAHCSELKVKTGDRVRLPAAVALTGNTGYSLGEHLHYSVIVQGYYADPNEWRDGSWVKREIVDVLNADLANIHRSGTNR